MVDFKSLEIVYWITILGSFNKAAQKMNTTQPAVSQRVQQLEQRLGFSVFDRTSRSVKLTSKGRILADYAESFLRLRSEMINTLVEPDSMSGMIRLGAAETIANSWLPDFLTRAHAVYPHMHIEVVVDISPALRRALHAKEIDMAFMLTSSGDSNLIMRELCSFQYDFMASPELGLPKGRISRRELVRYPLLTLPGDTYPHNYLREILMSVSGRRPEFITNWSLGTIIRMAVHKVGVCVVSRAAAREELKKGLLEIKDTDIPLDRFHFSGAYGYGTNNMLLSALADLAAAVTAERATAGVITN